MICLGTDEIKTTTNGAAGATGSKDQVSTSEERFQSFQTVEYLFVY